MTNAEFEDRAAEAFDGSCTIDLRYRIGGAAHDLCLLTYRETRPNELIRAACDCSNCCRGWPKQRIVSRKLALYRRNGDQIVATPRCTLCYDTERVLLQAAKLM